MSRDLQAPEKKRKREQRRRNHFAKDLTDPKYHQRVKNGKRPRVEPTPKEFEWDENDAVYYWEDNPVDHNGELI